MAYTVSRERGQMTDNFNLMLIRKLGANMYIKY